MELNEALKVVVELAEQNMLDDPEMQLEMLYQLNAIETVRMHMQELESPSDIQVVLVTDGNLVYEAYCSVPTTITLLDDDLEGIEDGGCRQFPSHGDAEYYVTQIFAGCDPLKVATLVREATA